MDESMPLRFHTPNAVHARMIDRLAAETMKNSGFHTLRIGFEMSNPELQKKTGGKVTSRDVAGAIRYLLEAGFQSREIGVYVMTGIPGVTFEDIREALFFVHDQGAMSRITEYSPLPSTPLWHIFPGSGSAAAEDPLFHNNTYHTYMGTVLPYEDYQNIKSLSAELNNMPEQSLMVTLPSLPVALHSRQGRKRKLLQYRKQEEYKNRHPIHNAERSNQAPSPTRYRSDNQKSR